MSAVLALSACDDQLDITPKGKTILEKTADLEKLLNRNWDLGDPGPLCMVVNECYPDNDVPTVLSQKNTLNYALLTYDETIDRGQPDGFGRDLFQCLSVYLLCQHYIEQSRCLRR